MTTELISSSCTKHKRSQVSHWPHGQNSPNTSLKTWDNSSGVCERLRGPGLFQGTLCVPSAQENDDDYTLAQPGHGPQAQTQT